MPARANHHRLLEELRALAAITNRRPPPLVHGKLWAATRPPVVYAAARKRRIIAVTKPDASHELQQEQAVTIVFGTEAH